MAECMVPLLIIPALAVLLVLVALAWRWSTELIKSPQARRAQ